MPDQEFTLTNRNLLLPYLVPYVAYVGISSLFQRVLSFEWIYVLRLVIVPVGLIWAWKWYMPITGPRSKAGSISAGIAGGLLGCFAWVFLLGYFVEPSQGEPWSDTGFFLRLASAVLLVPVFEEMLMRGYFFRVALQWDVARRGNSNDPFGKAYDEDNINTVEPGAWSFWAITISTLIFTAGHGVSEWVPAIVYGLLMSWLWIIRKDILSCIVAHGVTNFALACYVKYTGQWGFW